MNKRICRLCLAYPSVCFSLLENNLSEMLEALTSIKVNPNDVMSTISCMKCLLNMKLAFSIQQNILKADEKLKGISLLNNVEVKLEVSDIVINTETIENNFSKFSDSELFCSKCVICGKKMEGTLLAKHVEEHFSDTQTCDCCNKSFSNISEYKAHQQSKDLNQCETCGVTFRYKSLYNIHITQAHKSVFKLKTKKARKGLEQGPFSCAECKKEFPFRRQMRNHNHLKKKCPVCESEITKSNFRKHLMNHSSGPQICELCGATLRSLESLRGHIAHTHSTAIYNCDQCEQVFRKRYAYLLHKKKHSGEKSHICETCGKAFLTFYYLNKHIKTAHLKLRPFICEYCHKGFSSRFALRTHVRQHTNETPYKCEVCGEGFRQNVSLRAHRKSKHNIVESKTCACQVCGKLFGTDHAVMAHMRLH